MMTEMIEAIRAAVADGATSEQKAAGAQACSTILTALGAEAGKPIVPRGAPPPHPFSGISIDQALTLIIARLTTLAEAREAAEREAAQRESTSARPASPNAAPQVPPVRPPAAKQSATSPRAGTAPPQRRFR